MILENLYKVVIESNGYKEQQRFRYSVDHFSSQLIVFDLPLVEYL